MCMLHICLETLKLKTVDTYAPQRLEISHIFTIDSIFSKYGSICHLFIFFIFNVTPHNFRYSNLELLKFYRLYQSL